MIETIDNYLNETEVNNFYDSLKHSSIPWFIGPDHLDSKIKNKSFVKGFTGREIDFLVNECIGLLKSYLETLVGIRNSV